MKKIISRILDNLGDFAIFAICMIMAFGVFFSIVDTTADTILTTIIGGLISLPCIIVLVSSLSKRWAIFTITCICWTPVLFMLIRYAFERFH